MLSSSSEEKWQWTQIRLNLNFKKKKRSNNLNCLESLRASFSINMRLKFRWKHFVFTLCRETQVCPQWPMAVSFDMFELSVQCQTLFKHRACVCVCVRTKLEGPLVGALRGGEALLVFVRRRRWKAGTRLLRLWQRRETRLVLAVTTVTWKQFATLCNAVVLIIRCASSHRSNLWIHSVLLSICWVTLPQQRNGYKTQRRAPGVWRKATDRGQVYRRLAFMVAFVLHVITSQHTQTCCYDSDHAHQEVLNCNGKPVDLSRHSWNEAHVWAVYHGSAWLCMSSEN